MHVSQGRFTALYWLDHILAPYIDLFALGHGPMFAFLDVHERPHRVFSVEMFGDRGEPWFENCEHPGEKRCWYHDHLRCSRTNRLTAPVLLECLKSGFTGNDTNNRLNP